MTMNSERPWLASADSQAGVTTKFRHAPHGKTWAFAKQCIWLWHSLSAGDARLVLLNLSGGGCKCQGTQGDFMQTPKNIQFLPSGVLHKRFALPVWPLNSSLDLHVTSSLSRRLHHNSQFVNKTWAAFLSSARWWTVCVEFQRASDAVFWRWVTFWRQLCRTLWGSHSNLWPHDFSSNDYLLLFITLFHNFLF